MSATIGYPITCWCGELHEGGALDFNSFGVAHCSDCGWRGVAMLEPDGRASTHCPVCEPVLSQDEIMVALAPLQPAVGRNDPCTCGSGRKSKKCCGA